MPFPASGASAKEEERRAGIGRLAGGAGQLIDCIMDYDSDMETGGRNCIGVDGAINGATERVSKASGFP